jgi:putative tryptophan/tyrosine transport system substrate-binding protein
MSLGPGHLEGYREAAKYVDKILHGANPAELPVAGVTQIALSVRRSTLAKLGLPLPPDITARVNDWLD